MAIVIPTRNRTSILKDCLLDLIKQDYPKRSFEVLVVDDGSLAETETMVRVLAERHPDSNLRYLSQNGRGPSSARNLGTRASQADLLVFIDDDVSIPPDWLLKFVSAAERHPHSACLAGRIRLSLEGDPPRTCGRESIGESEVDQGDVDAPAQLDGVGAGNLLVRRSAFDTVGPFLEDLPVYGEETEWVHRLTSHGGSVTYVADAWLWHRRGVNELRLKRMLKARYHRGRSWPRIAPFMEREVSVAQGLWRIVPSLGHAGRHRCWVGVFDALYWWGHTREAVSMVLKGTGDGYIRWLPRHPGARVRDKLLGGEKRRPAGR